MRRTFPASKSAPSKRPWSGGPVCLQSNVDFLQKTITKLTSDHQQKLDAANRQIEALKSAVVGLAENGSELQTAQSKAADDAKKTAAPAAKDAAPAKDGAK